MTSFIETQKELAKSIYDTACLGESPYKPSEVIEIIVTQVLANHAKELVRKIDGMSLVNRGVTEDTPVCDNESCSAFNAYNQALDKAISIINSSGISIE